MTFDFYDYKIVSLILRMMTNCRQSCQSCQGGDRAWQLRSELTKNYDNSTSVNATRLVSIESVRIQHMEIVNKYINIKKIFFLIRMKIKSKHVFLEDLFFLGMILKLAGIEKVGDYLG